MRGIFAWGISTILVGGTVLLANDVEDSVSVGAGEWSVSAGLGYKENVLFSEILPVDSAFSYVSLEGVAQRDFLASGAEWVSVLLLDNRSYTQVDDLPDETFAMFLSEFSKHVTIDGRLTAGVQYVYFNQAFDASFDVLDENRVVLTAEEPGLSLKWTSFFWQFEYAASVGASRMYFKDSEDDYETLDWKFEIDYEVNERARLYMGVNGFIRDYTDRQARDIEGFRLEDTILGTDQSGIEGGFEQSFRFLGMDGELELEVDYTARRDRHTGYYDRDRLKYGMEWKFEGEKWNFDVDISYAENDYLLQVSDDGALRVSDEWIWGLEIDRKLSPKWSLFFRANGETSDSNESFFSYQSNSVLLGLRYR